MWVTLCCVVLEKWSLAKGASLSESLLAGWQQQTPSLTGTRYQPGWLQVRLLESINMAENPHLSQLPPAGAEVVDLGSQEIKECPEETLAFYISLFPKMSILYNSSDETILRQLQVV